MRFTTTQCSLCFLKRADLCQIAFFCTHSFYLCLFCVYLAEGGEVRKTEPVGKVEFNDQVMWAAKSPRVRIKQLRNNRRLNKHTAWQDFPSLGVTCQRTRRACGLFSLSPCKQSEQTGKHPKKLMLFFSSLSIYHYSLLSVFYLFICLPTTLRAVRRLTGWMVRMPLSWPIRCSGWGPVGAGLPGRGTSLKRISTKDWRGWSTPHPACSSWRDRPRSLAVVNMLA